MPDVLGRLRTPRLASAPATPAVGEVYYNTGTNVLAVWNGTAWAATAGAALPADTVIVAATRVISNLLLGTDTQPAWRVYGDGKQQWGPGGTTAPDASIYRSAGGTLRVTEILEVNQQLNVGVLNNAYIGLKSDNNGIYFGAASDTNLYRASAGVLKTDGVFQTGNWFAAQLGTNQVVAGEISPFIGGVARPGLLFGGSSDTNLYRAGAGALQTDGTFVSGGAALNRVELSVDRVGGGQAAINFGGPTPDTYLYRKSAGNLQINGGLYVNGMVLDAAQTAATIYIGGQLDTWLVRGGAGIAAFNSRVTAGGKDVLRSQATGLRHIETGTAQSSSTSYAVTFATAFSVAPRVFVNITASGGAWASAVTTSGFTMNNPNGGNTPIYWLAEGAD